IVLLIRDATPNVDDVDSVVPAALTRGAALLEQPRDRCAGRRMVHRDSSNDAQRSPAPERIGGERLPAIVASRSRAIEERGGAHRYGDGELTRKINAVICGRHDPDHGERRAAHLDGLADER